MCCTENYLSGNYSQLCLGLLLKLEVVVLLTLLVVAGATAAPAATTAAAGGTTIIAATTAAAAAAGSRLGRNTIYTITSLKLVVLV